jgi:hypothetical protein
MSNSKDEGGPGNDSDPDKPYKVGNKKPPLHTCFSKGKSGNPGGRPKASSKDLANFGDLLMKELYKTVPASLGGKKVNKMQGEIFMMQMMKAAINGKVSDADYCCNSSKRMRSARPKAKRPGSRNKPIATRRSTGTKPGNSSTRSWQKLPLISCNHLRLTSEDRMATLSRRP